MSKGSHSADSRRKPIAVICAAALLLIVGAFFLFFTLWDHFAPAISPGVTIAGLDVGEMSKAQARKALQSSLESTLYQQNLTVELPENTLIFSPADTGVRVDIRAAVNAASRVSQSPASLDLQPFLSVNTDFIRSALTDYAGQFDTTFAEAQYKLSGAAPSLSTENFDPNAPCQTLELTAGVPEAHLDVENTLALVLSVYGQAIAACRDGSYSLTVAVTPSSVPSALDLNAIYGEVCTAPVNDSLDMETYQFVHGSYGYAFDLDAAEEAMALAAPGDTVCVPMTVTEPEILGDSVYFRDVLGSCDTKHGDNENRNTNLRLLCEALNGVIVQPGETFSYNDTLGERTAEKGYKPAPAYSGNRLTDAIGGGVCQGSSTLYNCVLLADLEVVARSCHGATVAYLPLGLEAAVNWGTTDFQFRNNFHFPVKIEAETTEDYVKMKILGTDEKDYYIEMTSGYDDSNENYIYAVSYKNKYSKETGELISKDREAFSTYYRDIG